MNKVFYRITQLESGKGEAFVRKDGEQEKRLPGKKKNKAEDWIDVIWEYHREHHANDAPTTDVQKFTKN